MNVMRWLRLKWLKDLYHKIGGGQPHRKSPKRRPQFSRLALERLEDRTMLSISVVSAGGVITFSGSSTDHLYVKQAGSFLDWNSNGSSTYNQVAFAVGNSVVVSSMGQVDIVGSIATQGGSINISALNGVTVDNATSVSVVWALGTFSGGGDAYSVTGVLSNTVIMSRTSGSTPLTEGELLAFSGTSSGGLASGSSYAVHVISQTNPSIIQIQLYEPVIVSTSSTTGAAGSITLSATRTLYPGVALFTDPAPGITVGNYDELQAKGSTSSGDGAIKATASDTITQSGVLLYDDLFGLNSGNYTATVSVNQGAVVNGGAVTMTATAGDISALTSLSPYLSGDLISPLETYFNSVASLPLSVLIKSATAKVEIASNATITSSGAVSLTTTATPNATGEAVYWEPALGGVFGASFAYDSSTSTADTLVDSGATILSAGSVTISATTKTTTASTSRVTENTGSFATNPNTILVAFGFNDLTSTTDAIVAAGATIDAPNGNVTVTAGATDKDTATVQTASYHDGLVGLTGAVSLVNANVKAYVGGTVIAGGAATGSTETFNPFQTVDFANSSFAFASNPGYTTGEPLVYSSGLGGAVPNLTTDTIYYAIVTSSGGNYYVQLADSADDAAAGTFIPFGGGYPTINGIPITDVDSTTPGNDSTSDSLLFDYNPNFTEGQAVTITPQAGQALGYDNSAGGWAGLLSGTYYVHIVSSLVDANDQYTMQLYSGAPMASGGTLVQIDDSPYLTTSTNQVIRIAGFDTGSNELTLNSPDLTGLTLTNAEALTYHAGLATDVTGLTDNTTYYAIYDPTNPSIVELAANQEDAESADPTTRADVPTLSWYNTSTNMAETTSIEDVEPGMSDQLIGSNNDAYSITASNSANNTITAVDQPGYTSVPTVGELVTFEGQIGTSTTLQDGVVYSVASVTEVTSTEFTLKLKDSVVLATLGTLSTPSSVSPAYSYTIGSYDADNNTVTMALSGTGTDTLTEGEQLVYTGSGLGGNTTLQNGTTYYVHIIDQDASDAITVQLTANYPVQDVLPNTLTDSSNDVYTITGSDPGSTTLTVTGSAALSVGTVLTYNGPAVALPGYLQSGDEYSVSTVSNTATNTYQIELVSEAYQQASAAAPTAPATNLGLLQGTGLTYDILSSDSSTGTLTVALDPSSELNTVSTGATLTFEGTSGSSLYNTLQNGQSYTVAFVGSQTNTSDIQLDLVTTALNLGYGELATDNSTFIIHGIDAGTGTLTLSAYGSAQGITDGDTVTYDGPSGTGAGFLQNGQTYSVILVNGDDSNNIQIQLTQYVVPTYGTVSASGGPSFTITGTDTNTDSLTLAENNGSTTPLTEGETVTYAGASIAGTELLQNGDQYTVHIIDQSDPSAIEVQLLNPSAPFVVDATSTGTDPLSNAILLDTTSPTPQTLIPGGTIVTYTLGSTENQIGGLTNGMSYETVVDPNNPSVVHLEQVQTLQGTGQSFLIDSIDSSDNLKVTLLPGATTTSLTNGTTLTFVGASGSVGSLQNGVTYTVQNMTTIDSTDFTIQLVASGSTTALADSSISSSGQTVQLSLNETLVAGNSKYAITGYNGYAQTINVNTSSGLFEGEAVTYQSSFDASTGSVLQGTTYYVHIPNAADPTVIQLVYSFTPGQYTEGSGLLSSAADPNVLDIQGAVDLTDVDTAYMSGASQSLTPFESKGVTIKATLTSSDHDQAKSGIGSVPKISDILQKGELAPQLLNIGSALQGKGAIQESIEAKGKGTSQYSFSGSFVYEDITNTLDAEVGPSAVHSFGRGRDDHVHPHGKHSVRGQRHRLQAQEPLEVIGGNFPRPRLFERNVACPDRRRRRGERGRGP